MYRAFFKRVRTDELHRLLNSSAAVCTEYILCASDRSPESVPAAYSESIKAFIQIITISLFHSFPLQERPPAGHGWTSGSAGCRAGRVGLRRSAAVPPQRLTLLPNRRSVGRTPLAPAVLTISTWSASANSLDDPSCRDGSVVVKDVLW